MDKKEKTHQVYVDMDGVLTDFDKSFLELAPQYKSGREAEDALGTAGFWDIIRADKKFWFEMNWMPDGKKLWEYVKQFKPIINTVPSKDDHPTSEEGKAYWIAKHLGTNYLWPIVLAESKKKGEYALKQTDSIKGSILIDDRAENLEEWKEKGGIPILHISAKNTIFELKKILNNEE